MLDIKIPEEQGATKLEARFSLVSILSILTCMLVLIATIVTIVAA